jgi:hypothetical protein
LLGTLGLFANIDGVASFFVGSILLAVGGTCSDTFNVTLLFCFSCENLMYILLATSFYGPLDLYLIMAGDLPSQLPFVLDLCEDLGNSIVDFDTTACILRFGIAFSNAYCYPLSTLI